LKKRKNLIFINFCADADLGFAEAKHTRKRLAGLKRISGKRIPPIP
jgi:hypothetical protein